MYERRKGQRNGENGKNKRPKRRDNDEKRETDKKQMPFPE